LDKRKREGRNTSNINYIAASCETSLLLTDDEDNIVWATDSFYELLNKEKNDEVLNWGNILGSEVFTSAGPHRIRGAVKIKCQVDKNFILKSKIVKNSENNHRLIEISPMHDYSRELEKSVGSIATKLEKKDKNVLELGHFLEKTFSELSYLFQSSGTKLEIETNDPVIAKFDKEVLKKGIKSLINGIVLYLNVNTDQQKIIISYTKINDEVFIKVRLPRVKIGSVSIPLVYQGKKFPSLAAFLSKTEKCLIDYNAKLNLKNFYTKPDEIKESVFELSVTESKKIKTIAKKPVTKDAKIQHIPGKTTPTKIRPLDTLKDFH